MKKLIVFAVCIALLAGGGFFGYRQYEKSQDKKTVVDVVPVSYMAETADMFMSYTSTDGQIVSANTQKVYADSEKLVKTVFVSEGDEVKKGDVLLEYDMTVVELELAQKENNVKVIEQNIAAAQKALESYKTYKPSENAPATTEPENGGDAVLPDAEMPDMPDMQDGFLVNTVSSVTPTASAAFGSGSADDPAIYLCSENTVVSSGFMTKMIQEQKRAELWVFDEASEFLYKWVIIPERTDASAVSDWKVSDGITKDGGILLDTTRKYNAVFSFGNASEIAEMLMPSEPVPENEPEYAEEPTEPTAAEPTTEADPAEYMYSRKEIAKMITEKENEIKQLNIDLKQAQLEYETSKKETSDGRVTAKIDGVVKKISQDTAVSDGSDDYSGEYEYSDEPADDSFMVIEGSGGVEVEFYISEYFLEKAPVGTKLMVTDWNTSGTSEATVSEVSTEPSEDGMYGGWGTNPNSSTYRIRAVLDSTEDINIDDWVEVKFMDSDESTDNSLYLPAHYIRSENGSSYILKADDNNRLEKQYISVGKTLYGYYIEVKGGISMDDRICFPYGKKVREGVRTRDSEEVLYPDAVY